MSSKAVIQNNNGAMDYDTNEVYVNNGNYYDAKNIEAYPAEQGDGGGVYITKGNKLAYTKSLISAQNKKFRFSNIDGDDYQLKFSLTNNIEIGTTAIFTDVAGCQSEIDTLFPNTYYNVRYTNVTSNGLDVEIAIQDLVTPSNDVLGFDVNVVVDTPDKFPIIILQEAYSLNMEGELIDIGSIDITGDLVSFNTTNDKTLNSSITQTIAQITAAFPAVVTIVKHGYQTGEYVNISGLPYPDTGNGVCLVRSLTANTFELCGVDRTAYSTYNYGFAQLYNQGVGQIGVAQKDENDDTWSYVALLTSKELNYSAQKQIEADGDKDINGLNIRYTDNYNNPRRFSYKGDYETNGALNYINSNNIYSYGNIDVQSLLQPSTPNAIIEFFSQQQSGGNLLCGNYRYAVCFSDGISNTEWTPLSNPIPVYIGDNQTDTSQIIGGNGGDNSSKANILSIILNGGEIYKYIKVAYVRYTDGGFTGGIFIQQEISGNTVLSITHYGEETEEQPLDLGLLNSVYAKYIKAKSICSVDNTTVISNITTEEIFDFTEYTQLFRHSLFKNTLEGVGEANGYGEYKVPSNVFGLAGYMIRERYRFYARYKMKRTGTFTQPFWIDDIVIDTLTYSRRDDTLTDYDLTNADCTEVYVPYVVIKPHDLSYQISGVQVRDLVESIYIDRVELTNNTRQVLTSGMMVLGVKDELTGSTFPPPAVDKVTGLYYSDSVFNATPSIDYVGEYPLYFGGESDAMTAILLSSRIYPATGAVTSFTAMRRFQALHSQDVLLGQVNISYRSGDKIINFGQPNPSTAPNGTVEYTGNSLFECSTIIYNNANGRDESNIQELSVDELRGVSYQETKPIGGETFSKSLIVGHGSAEFVGLNSQTGYVAYTDINATKQTANDDFGIYYFQYFREKTALIQYGATNQSKSSWTGAQIIVNESASNTGNAIAVFGGDVFTQMCNTRNRQPVAEYASDGRDGLGCGLMYYSQNIVNTQLRNKYIAPDGVSYLPFPAIPAYSQTSDNDWLKRIGENTIYNRGYSITNGINSYRAYNASIKNNSFLPATIAYGLPRTTNSYEQGFEIFLPLNRKDLDLTKGEIVHHTTFNSELIVFQRFAYLRLFFNSTSILTTTDGAEAVLGDGSVLGRKPQILSNYGCNNKWSFVKGKSNGGNDAIYWIDTTQKMVFRFGADGVIPISVRARMDSFFQNNLTWVEYDTPANGQGICGVWNERLKQVIWSVRGYRRIQVYDIDNSYAIGEVVLFTPSTFSTFNKTGEYYLCIEDADAEDSPDVTPNKWQIIPHSNNAYYNEYSIVWSELRNGFISFLTPLPKIFLTWKNSYLTPRPISNVSNVYEHNRGDYATWYIQSAVEQSEDGYIESAFNIDPNVSKTAEATRVYSDVAPYGVIVKTNNQQTSLQETDFLLREDMYDSTIKNDELPTGNNDDDTSKVYGHYFKYKFIFEKKVKQYLRTVILKIRLRTRYFNR